jgi:hypothetical protein
MNDPTEPAPPPMIEPDQTDELPIDSARSLDIFLEIEGHLKTHGMSIETALPVSEPQRRRWHHRMCMYFTGLFSM